MFSSGAERNEWQKVFCSRALDMGNCDGQEYESPLYFSGEVKSLLTLTF